MLPARPASGQHAEATDEALEKLAAKPVLDLTGLKGPGVGVADPKEILKGTEIANG